VDTWWQTETGAIMIAPLPGVTAAKPGSAMHPLPGISARIVDEYGKKLKQARDESGSQSGYLVIDAPWPAMLRGIWGDSGRFIDTYWSQFTEKGWYFTGDGARVDADESIWVLGRLDDVMNVSGHRISSAEVESALLGYRGVVDVAVVGDADESTGQRICAFVVVEPHPRNSTEMIEALSTRVTTKIGKIARPSAITWCPIYPRPAAAR
jgi:acetyl-CoA synthetase